MFVTGDKITTVKYEGGPSFRNARLVFEDKQVKVVPTLRAYVLESVFQVIIWSSCIFMFHEFYFVFDQELLKVSIYLFVFCFVFSFILHYFLAKSRVVKVFNDITGFFYTGIKNEKFRLVDIEILLLIGETIHSSSNSYRNYEMSFFTLNGDQVLIMSHADRDSLIIEIRALAKYLNKPWQELEWGHIYGDE